MTDTNNGFKKISFSADNPEIIDLKNNSYDIFLSTLDDATRNKDIAEQGNELIHGHIYALYNFQTEAIPKTQECIGKCFSMISTKMALLGCSSLHINQVFEGTKKGLSKEDISFSMFINHKDELMDNKTEPATSNSQKTRTKTSYLISQQDNVISIFHQFKNNLVKDSFDAAYLTACFVLIADFSSKLNSQDITVNMEGIMHQDVVIAESATATMRRIEVTPQNKTSAEESESFFDKIRSKLKR